MILGQVGANGGNVRKLLSILFVSTSLAGQARAADKPLIASPPAWVKPVAPAPAPPRTDAAILTLLGDQQVSVGADKMTTYVHAAFIIQTPQGLDAGNLSFAWRADLDTLTVHKIRIRRGSEEIDVLASGQAFTVARREPKLENAALDGVLTANIQPEGLQVGDTLEFAYSVTSRDPTLKGHAEFAGAAWNGVPVERAHFRMEWPATRTMRFSTSPSLPKIKTVRSGSLQSAEITLEKLQPVVLPKGAPPRFQIGRLLQATDFAGWNDLSRLLAPLYAEAAAIPAAGPLRIELERIKAQSADPVVRAEAALALVQDRVRYVALAMGVGGLVPTTAETTWARRFGDCKAKTVLLLALLKELGIAAEPVAVSLAFGDGLNERLPMAGNFDHVIVRANVAGRTVWMDGTRTGDLVLDKIAVPALGWGLPLTTAGSDLVRLVPPPLAEPGMETLLELDAREGISLPAPAKAETIIRGDDAVSVNLQLGNLSGAPRDQALRGYWKTRYDFIDPKSVSVAFDAKARELRLRMDGTARMDWSSGTYWTDETGVGYKADFSREGASDRAAPYGVPYPFYTRMVERIMLPPGFAADTMSRAPDVDETVAGLQLRRFASFKDDVFTIETTQRAVAPEFPASEAPAAEKRLRELADQSVGIRIPATYAQTDKELAAMMAEAPTTVDAYLKRGNLLLDAGRANEAWTDFDAAATKDPRNGSALAARGIASVWKGDYAAAARDFDAAFAIDPKEPVIFRGRGLAAYRQGAYADAAKALTTSLEFEPHNAFALAYRAFAYRELGENDKALDDAAAALKAAPTFTEVGSLRFQIYRERDQLDRAFASLNEMVEGAPRSAEVLVSAARSYADAGNREVAMQLFDRALAVKREAWVFVNRAWARPAAARAERRADLDAALALDAAFTPALLAKAKLLLETGAFSEAADTYTTALAKIPDSYLLLGGRGIARAKAGKSAEADRDFAAARRLAKTATSLNNLCWEKVTASVALETALAECDAAQRLSPDSNPVRDSRGMALLRLGRIDEAIAEFDKVLADDRRYPTSRYGRGLAYIRKGDKTRAELDFAEARKLDPDIEATFRSYGLSP